MKKLRILFTMTPPFDPNAGGVQRTTFKLGKKFSELGHEICYFSLCDKGNLNSMFGKLYHASHSGGANNQKNIFELQELLEIIKPNFVINQMPYEVKLSQALFESKDEIEYILLGCLRNSLFSVRNNVRDTSKRVLPTYLFNFFDNKLGLSLLLQIHKFKHKKQLKRILDLHDKFILLAPPNKKELNYFVGNYKNEKVSVIPNSIPNILNEPVKKEKLILHVGRLNIPQKRADLLVEFWKQTKDKLKDWNFVIIGEGPLKEEIENQINQENISRITMLGYQKPEEWYKKASIFMMPSAFEGFPNVILEAQSFGCVPVAFRSYDAISWIVNENIDSILIKPFNIDEMSKQVVALAEDNSRLFKMAEASKNNASKFVVENVAKEWMDLFENIEDFGK